MPCSQEVAMAAPLHVAGHAATEEPCNIKRAYTALGPLPVQHDDGCWTIEPIECKIIGSVIPMHDRSRNFVKQFSQSIALPIQAVSHCNLIRHQAVKHVMAKRQ